MRCDPRIAVVPDRVKTAGPQITGLAKMAGIELDEAQQFVAGATSGVNRDNKWAAFECVIFAPRQNIKTEYLIARALAGLFLFQESYVVYSSHQVKTSTKTFKRLKRAIDRNPRLGGRIARVSNRIGAESVELTTGQVLECVARSTNSGRGFTGDCLLLDEAHELDTDDLAAILPMMATRANPQVVYGLSMGTDSSYHLAGLRERALVGKPDVCWIEWSMAEDARVDDRRVWAACNPAFPARISMEYMEREFAALGPEAFARERLGKSDWPTWAPGEWEVIAEDAWLAGGVADARMDGPAPVLVSVEASRSREWESWPDGIPPWIPRV